jgi:chorismate dehydratase
LGGIIVSPKQLRIGQISYTNTLPVYFFFQEERFQEKIDFIQQVPAQLNEAMAKGAIDVGPISSFSYAEHQEHYLVLPGLSISAKGKVRSIFLFSKRPIEELNGAKITMTNTSATSVNLLKIIMGKFLDHTVTYETQAPVLEEMMAHADGALLIGDDALLAYRNNKGYHVYDLAELWYRYTGHSMTFAVWAVRKEAIRLHGDLLREVHAAFLSSKERSLRHLEQVVEDVHARFGGEKSFWFEYFRGLCYDFTEEQRAGLEYYYACAAELGLLRAPVKVRLWEEAAQQETLR